MLIDPFQRKISYVRVSVTDRCDFRCTSCMSEEMEFLPKKDVLSLEELDRLCNTFSDLGVKKLRITGGEPLVRKNIMKLFSNLGKKIGHGLEELTLTTNGSQLERYAKDLLNNCIMFFLTRGSPPVILSFFTPRSIKVLQSLSNSSKDKTSFLGKNSISSDMQ